MKPRFFITGMGIVSPLGVGCRDTVAALISERRCLAPLTLFSVAHDPALPVGQVAQLAHDDTLPRTHRLALMAAREAMQDQTRPPGAVIVGTTTGGMLRTENLLKAGNRNPAAYKLHAPHTVSGLIADRLNCNGVNLTLSTACASAITAIHLALRMLGCGAVRRVLVGGADSLSRLTYYGFSALQLIDPKGARPLDRDRRGMSVAEAAAFVLIESAIRPPVAAVGELLGSGLSCDAHHVTQPHPKGNGARQAMRAALLDAGLGPRHIDYVHLHGTGTFDNDAAEALAVSDLFGKEAPPYCASLKGATGHGLAAAGAVGLVTTLLSMAHGFMPANLGCRSPDPNLPIAPLLKKRSAGFSHALINAFGFGGNNGSVVVGHSLENTPSESAPAASATLKMNVIANACRTGAGDLQATHVALEHGRTCAGCLADDRIDQSLTPRRLRRLKRLPRIVSGLAADILLDASPLPAPDSLIFSTAWGALTETYDFLTHLFAHDECYPSPTDFVGSVHNAPAGQVAIRHHITGANITLTGGERSFEQAFQAACLQGAHGDRNVLLISADEYHPDFSALLDAPTSAPFQPADGGAAFYLSPAEADTASASIELLYYGRRLAERNCAASRIQFEIERAQAALCQSGKPLKVAAVLHGGSEHLRVLNEAQLENFQHQTGIGAPYIDYRLWLGNFPTVSAAAVSTALGFLQTGRLPEAMCPNGAVAIDNRAILVLSLGQRITLFAVKKC